jgi:ribosomal-protein-alanine N-acetyltransferase
MCDDHAGAIETTRLRLRTMLATDLDDLLGIFGDPKVMAAFSCPPFDREQMRRWLQRNLGHQQEHGYGLFAVILKADDALIGDCGLEAMDDGDGTVVELGYDFRSDHWNQGYATEAAVAVRDYAFGVLKLPRLVSFIRVANRASQRVAEKVGMERVRQITRYGCQYWEYAMDRTLPDQ